MTPKLKLTLALSTVYVVWGSTYLALKYALVAMPPFLLVGVRNLIAGIVLAVIASGAFRRGIKRPHLIAGVANGFFLIVLGNGTVTYAQGQGVPSAVAALVVGLMPAWMAAIGAFSGTRFAKSRIEAAAKVAGIVLGLAGLVLLIGSGKLSPQDASPLPAALLVLGTFAWAFASVRSKMWPAHPETLAATSLTMLGGAVLAIVVGLGLGEASRFEASQLTTTAVVAFGYLVIFGSVIGFSAFAWLLKNADPALVGTYAYVNPLVALLLGSVIAGEELGPRVLLAAPLILLAVALVSGAPVVNRLVVARRIARVEGRRAA